MTCASPDTYKEFGPIHQIKLPAINSKLYQGQLALMKVECQVKADGSKQVVQSSYFDQIDELGNKAKLTSGYNYQKTAGDVQGGKYYIDSSVIAVCGKLFCKKCPG
jgi:hypothetical protein